MRLGLVGAGSIAGVHAYAARQVPGLAVTAVASRTEARARAAAERAGAEVRTLEDIHEVVDGVVIATPPAHHAAAARRAAAGGVGALVEKPLCTTLADADALVAAAQDGAVLAYAENLLHAPAVRLAVTHASALVGIDHLEVRAVQDRPTWGEFLSESWGGGVLFDLGAHPLALALALAGSARPVEVRATLTGSDAHPVDEHAEVTIAFDTGLQARVVASWSHPSGPVWDAQVSSPDGVVRLELLPHVALERNGAPVALPPIPADVPQALEELGYLPQIESFALDVRDARSPAIGMAQARDVLDLTMAAYWSAGRGGAWVELPFAGPRDATPLQLWRGA